jgi:hypothetical protein
MLDRGGYIFHRQNPAQIHSNKYDMKNTENTDKYDMKNAAHAEYSCGGSSLSSDEEGSP